MAPAVAAGAGLRPVDGASDALDAARIRAALPADCALRIAVCAQIDSTNAELLRRGAAAAGQALLAEQQSAGRGRAGRVWCSPPVGNLYLSLAWPAQPLPPPCLTLALGVAVAEALHRRGATGVRLKWPNDLQIDGAKLGGLLVEVGETVVAGLGLNRHVPPDAPRDQPVADLASAGVTVDRNALAADCLAALDAAHRSVCADGFAPFAARWRGLDALAGRPVRAQGAQGLVEGIACGVEADGRLRIDTGAGVVAVHSGDVSVRPQ